MSAVLTCTVPQMTATQRAAGTTYAPGRSKESRAVPAVNQLWQSLRYRPPTWPSSCQCSRRRSGVGEGVRTTMSTSVGQRFLSVNRVYWSSSWLVRASFTDGSAAKLPSGSALILPRNLYSLFHSQRVSAACTVHGCAKHALNIIVSNTAHRKHLIFANFWYS